MTQPTPEQALKYLQGLTTETGKPKYRALWWNLPKRGRALELGETYLVLDALLREAAGYGHWLDMHYEPYPSSCDTHWRVVAPYDGWADTPMAAVLVALALAEGMTE